MAAPEDAPWDAPGAVAGFARGSPNETLVRFAENERPRAPHGRALDLGCGAGRNAMPLARMGWTVTGVDSSTPMLVAAAQRAREAQVEGRARFVLAPMDHLPLEDRSHDLVIAHGIWNLARSGDEFRGAVREAARVSRPGAALFVFTFSRTTLPPGATPVAGERFVYTQFSGRPQCFLTEEQLLAEMAAVGFTPHEGVPLRELNRPRPGSLPVGAGPVILEAAFRLEPSEVR